MLSRASWPRDWRRSVFMRVLAVVLVGIISASLVGGLQARAKSATRSAATATTVRASNTSDQSPPRPERQIPAARRQPLTPLGSLLNQGGGLNPGNGFSGSVDPRGWSMTMGPGGEPHFVPTDQHTNNTNTGGASAPLSPGDENWDTSFGQPGVNNRIWSMAVTGTDVYMGGDFTSVAGIPVNYIARWNTVDQQWYTLGTSPNDGVNDVVYAITVSGSDLYVGGRFTTAGGLFGSHIARWNTIDSQWHSLANGLSGASAEVNAIAVSGGDVYVGGSFTQASQVSTYNVARWNANDNQWYTLGSGIGNSASDVYAMTISGNDLYVGGSFTSAGGVGANYIARWDITGSQWHALGSGANNGANNWVYAMAISGADLYVGGGFTSVGGVSANYIARWNVSSSQWYPLGSGANNGVSNLVYGIVIGSGGDVFVGGYFTRAGAVAANRTARWNTTTNQWYSLGSGVDGINQVAYSMGIVGTDLFVGGDFNIAGGLNTNYVARWNISSNQWHELGSGVNDSVHAVAMSGNDIYVGGDFTLVGGLSANHIARWNTVDHQWHTLGSGPNNGVSNSVFAIAISGSDVYVGGYFGSAGGISAVNIARWNIDSGQWFALGSGVNGVVNTIAVGLNDVYAGGSFTSAGGISAIHVARWNTADHQWHPLGVGSNNGVNSDAIALCVSGADVFVGGYFSQAGGLGVDHIARWNPARNQWYPLGCYGCGVNSTVRGIAASGSDLYVVGDFGQAGNVGGTAVVARWNTSDNSWYPLGTGVTSGGNTVRAVAVSGIDVYIGGVFNTVGGTTSAHFVARWDTQGSQWYGLGSGLNDAPEAIATNDSDVFAGGGFSVAGNRQSYRFGIWHAPPSPTPTVTPTRTPCPECPTDTSTPSSTPTATPTGTATSTPTVTPTSTRTYTPTRTPTFTNTPTVTNTPTATNTPVTANAFSYFQPGGPMTLRVSSKFTLDLMVYSGDNTIAAAQNYLTFTNSILQVVSPSQAGCVLTSTISPDTSVFDEVLQNEVCNSTSPCNLGRITAPPASIAFASGALGNPPVQGDFRVAQIAFCANAVGDATIHWEFSPPASPNRDSEIVDAHNNLVSNPTVYTDQVVHVVPGVVVGHVTWQGPPAQPSIRQQLPVTLTIKSGVTEINYPSQVTDASGHFTVTVGSLTNGTYNWRAKGPKYLATSGTLTLSSATSTSAEMGLQRAGDGNGDNVVSVVDVNVLKLTYGLGLPDPGYDARADFDNNNFVSAPDFTLLKSNFGFGGAPPIGP